MKTYRITVDTGTTNTRAVLWRSDTLIREEKAEIGVRCTAEDGHNTRLKQAVKGCIERLLESQGLTCEDLECILGCGMMTANVGLFEVPHLPAPAGIRELAAGMKQVLLLDICPVPFWLVPGVKNHGETVTEENFEQMDIMRGEEAETVAMLYRLPEGVPYLLILPGSHTKFVAVNAEGKITGCLTTLTGELLSVISRQTIVADAVGRGFAAEDCYHREAVRLGYQTARKVGLARAAFSTRILNLFGGYGHEQAACYLLGAVLEEDLRALRETRALTVSENTRIVIGGKGVFCRGFADVLACDGGFGEHSVLSPDSTHPLSAAGMFAIYEEHLRMKEQSGAVLS